MKPKLSLLFLSCVTLIVFCSPKIKPRTKQEQGINGFVYTISGNQMPMKNLGSNGKSNGRPADLLLIDSTAYKGLQTTIYIHAPTDIQQVLPIGNSIIYTAINTPLVATVSSDSSGAFSIALPEGDYSIFLKLGDRYYANNFNQFNQICPVKVEAGRFTSVKLAMNIGVTY